jgi:segregation and condensation protein A
MISDSFIEVREEEQTLKEPSPRIAAAPAISAESTPAAELIQAAGKGRGASKRAKKTASVTEEVAKIEIVQEAVPEPIEATASEHVSEPVVVPEPTETPEAETVNEVTEEPVEEPEAVIEDDREVAAEPVSALDVEAVDQAAEPSLEADLPVETASEPTPEPIAVPDPVAVAVPQRTLKPQLSAEEKEAARLAARQKKLDEGSEESPFSVIVGQVYDGPMDLLLDLIRKQDIDIYDIPIAIITSQFLSYVNQLRASDVDVAGDFIYTASLLIHIKSKMLLPHTETGSETAAEDPRRELVERLLEHERFKNAAQMLQQKQMLEAATWSNPGVREFKDDEAAELEIAADTVDLVRVFREILERARNRPVIDVEEDSVTVGQMIQFLARRLTMEDRPVALRRLLSHTRSERALIAMFLALLEMVRLQAILLRQDRQFSEIFIKKHSGFDAVMNEGLGNARDDWR